MAWQASLSMVLCAVLVGCSTPRASWFPQPTARTAGQAPGPVDFNWVLSGEKLVGPLQVFSDGAQTWMQWRPNQTLPAILAMQESGYAVVEYRRQDPYTIISGVYPSLLFRAGHHWSKATRVALTEPPPNAGQGNRSNAPDSQQKSVANSPRIQVAYAVSRADQHLRQALGRWANLSGWRFDPEHWSIDVDIPVSAEAFFSDDFVDSVQSLLSSTELSDRPVQPCFYTNQVLRVVPLAEACDRTVVSQESA